MFKFLPKNPDSVRSILKAGFQLYAASFKYALAFTIALSLIITISFFLIDTYTPINVFLASLFCMIIGMVFFIPLVKRIYSVGAGLPITTLHAYDGFFSHFIRVTILLCLLSFLPLIMLLIMNMASVYIPLLIVAAFVLVIGYFYFILKIYFTNIFIILENQHIWIALKNSVSIESHHMWLTFWVVFTFSISYLVLITFINPYIPNPLLQDIFNAAAGIIGVPLFLSIQICQYFNLKRLREQGS